MKFTSGYKILSRYFLASLLLLILVPPVKFNGEVNSMLQQGKIKLPSPNLKGKLSLEETLSKRRSIRYYQKESLNINEISQLLWAMQGITEKNWGLRTAPSAGALYPLEVYIVAGNVENLDAGIYKYLPDDHSIIKVSSGDKRRELFNSALQQESILQAPVVFVIAAVFERTAVKYGIRSERYVYIEAGHSCQNLLLQATSLNLGAVPIGAFYDDRVKETINLEKKEKPIYIIPVGRR